jgi:energy-coupling factor transporter ATP-binding protein EcfA2
MNPASATAITNPFPGLRPFREEEEHLFFGRELQVDAMVDKLAQRRFLAVVGSSGSGKSSLVNCGLRPALHQGRMTSAGTSWRMAQFRPGNHPLAALAQALAEDGVLFRNFEERGLPLVEIIDTTLRMSKRGLIDIFEQASLAKEVNLLLVVDQFEELFRYRQLTDGPQPGDQWTNGHGFSEEATAFVKLLLELQQQKDCPIFVVLTMRSDFLGDCTQYAGLAEAINAGLYLVPRLTPEERRDAIVNPIRVQGAEIEPVLVTRLVNDVGDNPDQLSILQHALNRTWANWQQEGGKDPLALRHYEAIGTMAGALDAHAEEAYAELSSTGMEPSLRQRICEKLFQALTDKATDGRGVRRPSTLGYLCALTEATETEVVEVIELFRQPSRSFLMPPAGENLTAEKVIDISHESLMRVWIKLKDWVDEEAQSAQIYRRLVETANLHAKGQAAPLRDPELTIFGNWQQKQKPNQAWAERYAPGFDEALTFLRFSKNEHEAELAEKERRREEEARRELEEANRARVAAEDRQRLLRRGLVGMGALSLVAVLSGGIAFSKFQEANRAKEEALSSKETADKAKTNAIANAKVAKASQHDAELQKSRADHQKSIADQQSILARQQAENAIRQKIIALDNQQRAERSAKLAVKNLDLAFVAIAKAQLSIDPFEAVVNGLAAMSRLANKSGESIGFTNTLAEAVTRNWQIGSIPTGQGNVIRLIELRNGELISSGFDGSLRRWKDGKPLGVR